MNRHYQTLHVNRLPHACSECPEKFRRKIQLKKHEVQKHTGEYSHKCPECHKGFLNMFTFTRHLTTHNQEKLKTCADCKFTFTKWSLLVEHRRKTHKTDMRFLCDICDRAFFRKVNIKQHMKAHFQPSADEVFQCHYENCPKFYTAKRNLEAHISSKHEGKRWTCDFCKRELSTKQKLAQHIAAHLDPKRAKKLLKKKSTLSRLVGVELPQPVEYKIIGGEGFQVSSELLPLPESTHETSGAEFSDF